MSPLYKIKIDYPIGWTKVEEGLPKPAVVCFTSPKEDVYDRFLENVGIGILQISKQITLDQYIQSNINECYVKYFTHVQINETLKCITTKKVDFSHFHN